jgi:hypothetical protein
MHFFPHEYKASIINKFLTSCQQKALLLQQQAKGCLRLRERFESQHVYPGHYCPNMDGPGSEYAVIMQRIIFPSSTQF